MKRVYLLGATNEIITEVAHRLRERHPGLHVECADGYFTDDQAGERAARIRACGTDILFVGMGVPRQEYFLEEQWKQLEVGIAIGVGGSFDVLSGVRARAPFWVQRIAMEWLFRLIQEPGRLFSRYLTTNSQFVWLVLNALLGRNKGDIERPQPAALPDLEDEADSGKQA
jgi:N-acetylglucosaminyldiphosphoundecaprenol N-acetyl-beta-D-mannosaminyltransferase